MRKLVEVSKNFSSCSYDKKLLQHQKVAKNRKSCQKVANQLVARPNRNT